MKLLQWFGALSFRRQVVLVGATALIAAGLAAGRKGPQAREPRGTAPAGAVAPHPPGAPLPEGPPSASLFATRLAPETLTSRESQREATPLAASYRREVVRPRPVEQSPLKEDEPGDAAANTMSHPANGAPANRRRDGKSTLPEIFRMPGVPSAAETGASAASAEPARPAGPNQSASPGPTDENPNGLSEGFAPFGRMIKCQLVNTLDSLTARTEPIIGLVTEDLAWNGRVIVPANTEVFSYAVPRGLVDARGTGRLVDSGQWILVLPGARDGENGRELVLQGRALDRRESRVTDQARARSWGIDDGADGLVGYTLSTLDEEEIKLFAAAAIGGLAQGAAAVAGRTQPAPGLTGLLGATEIAPTVADTSVGAASQGAVAVANQLAARIRDEIAQRGYYVRVPAGKEFYLWVEQTIDPRAARVGAELPGRAKDAARTTLSLRPSPSP